MRGKVLRQLSSVTKEGAAVDSDRRKQRRHVEYEAGRVVQDACYLLVGVLLVAVFLDVFSMAISWASGAQDPMAHSLFLVPLGDWINHRLATVFSWATR